MFDILEWEDIAILYKKISYVKSNSSTQTHVLVIGSKSTICINVFCVKIVYFDSVHDSSKLNIYRQL